MKRHYTRTAAGYRCINPVCRQEFGDRGDLGRHYGPAGKCNHPTVLGLTINLDVSPHHWVRAA